MKKLINHIPYLISCEYSQEYIIFMNIIIIFSLLFVIIISITVLKLYGIFQDLYELKISTKLILL